jgi:hypothetical protein
MRTFFSVLVVVSHKRPTKFHHISLTTVLDDVTSTLLSLTDYSVKALRKMTKTPRTADELKSDSDRIDIVSLSNRKVSQLADLIEAASAFAANRAKWNFNSENFPLSF